MRGSRLAPGLTAVVLALTLAAPALAAIREERVSYGVADSALEGYLYYDDTTSERRPGVLVIHEWWGLNDYARDRARQLASLGYVAFAADMYGKGRVTRHPDEAGAWAAEVTAHLDAWRGRALAAFERLREHPRVDAARLAAIGYCFGGASVLQLAYSGAPVRGVVSFHGGMPVAAPAEAAAIKAHILIEHGAADGFVKPDGIARFQAALAAAGVDWRMVYQGGARHGFTNPGADAYGVEGVAYDATADRRSWADMREFLREIFAE